MASPRAKLTGTADGRWILPLVVALAGCIESHGCTLLSVTSVEVTLTDERGAPVSGATLTYSANGGPSEDCFGGLDDGLYSCGADEGGTFEIRAEKVGYGVGTGSATVESGECHVETESLAMTLPAVDCTDNEVPSIEVSVAGSSGEALTGVTVTYAPAGGADPTACDGQDSSWICGYEESGDFVVTASADGHPSESVDVTVESDVCHVTTEHVDFSLDWAED